MLTCKRTDVAKSWKWAGFALEWTGLRSEIITLFWNVLGWGEKVLRCKRTSVSKSSKWAGFALKWAGLRFKIYNFVQERLGTGQKDVEV